MEDSLSTKTNDGVREYHPKKSIRYYAMSRRYLSPPASSLPQPCPRWLSASRYSNDSYFTINNSAHDDKHLRPRRLICAAKFSALTDPDKVEKEEANSKSKENDKPGKIVTKNNTEEVVADKKALQGLNYGMGGVEGRHEKVPPCGGA